MSKPPSCTTVPDTVPTNASPVCVWRGWALALSLTTWLPLAWAQQDIQVREQNGLLSVQASNTSARRLAEVLSEQLGINVIVTGDTEAMVNIDIVEEPLDKALAKLSPNHMLVRNGKQANSDIVEVVLMMGEGNASGEVGGGDDQFLPSGSPADDIVVDEQPTDGAELRDPNRAQMARDAAAAASSDSGLQQEVPPEYPAPEAFDPVTGLPIDPTTGLPLEQQ